MKQIFGYLKLLFRNELLHWEKSVFVFWSLKERDFICIWEKFQRSQSGNSSFLQKYPIFWTTYMQIFNQKNIICTLVVQNIGYFCKKLKLPGWKCWNFSHMQTKSRPKKDQKTIFLVSGAIHCENAIWNIQIFAFIFYELKNLRGPFWKICLFLSVW